MSEKTLETKSGKELTLRTANVSSGLFSGYILDENNNLLWKTEERFMYEDQANSAIHKHFFNNLWED